MLWDITSLPLLYFETSYLKTKNIFFCFFSHCSFQYTSVLLLEPISHNMINLLKRNTSETIIACQIVFHCYHAIGSTHISNFNTLKLFPKNMYILVGFLSCNGLRVNMSDANISNLMF